MKRLLILCPLILAACQSYEPMPLDDAGHEAAWRARTPELAADYAAQLREAGRTAPFDLSDGISLPEAEIVALFFHPDLRRARAEAGIAFAGATETGHWDDPELEVDAEYILNNVSDPWSIGGMLKFTIPVSGRLGIEEDRAWAEHRHTLAAVVAEEWRVLVALRAAWLELAAITEELRLTRALADDLSTLNTRAEALAGGGALSRLDARLVAIELASQRIAAHQLQTAQSQAELALREWLGLHPESGLELRPALAPREVDAAEARNPAVQAARARYEVTEQTLRLEIRKQYPDLVIGGGYGLEDGQSRVALGLGLPIPIINLNREGIARARAARVEARTAWEGAREQAAHDLARAAHARRRAVELAALVRETLVPLADDNAREAARLAELGEFDALRQLESLTRRHDARLAALRATAAEAEAANAELAARGPAWTTPEEQP